MKRVGIFGGTFDPPHLGHLELATEVLDQELVDVVCWVPVFTHAFPEKNPVSFWDRYFMTRLTIENDSRMSVWDLEAYIKDPQWSENVINEIAAHYPGSEFRFIVGADQYDVRHRWHDFDAVEKLAPPLWIARERTEIPGQQVVQINNSISSTKIRDMIADGEDVSTYVVEEVYNYILVKGFYRPEKKGS